MLCAWDPRKRTLISEPVPDEWKKELSCAVNCSECQKELAEGDERILSMEDHRVICMECKQKEERHPGYKATAMKMIAECMAKTGKPYGDTESYCFHHFAPYRCKK